MTIKEKVCVWGMIVGAIISAVVFSTPGEQIVGALVGGATLAGFGTNLFLKW